MHQSTHQAHKEHQLVQQTSQSPISTLISSTSSISRNVITGIFRLEEEEASFEDVRIFSNNSNGFSSDSSSGMLI